MGIYNREKNERPASSRGDHRGRPAAVPPHRPHILSLQQLNGNRGVHQLISTSRLRAKFTISTPGDRWERAADQAANQVLHAAPVGALPLTGKPGPQGQSMAPASAAAPAPVLDGIKNGRPLDRNLQMTMEQRFEADFGHVRIHTDAAAEHLNAALQARAVTHGSDIYFNQGQYHPWDRPGKHLLAHELAHVIQQQGRRGGWLQCTPMPQAEEPSPGTEADVREFLSEMLRFWQDGVDYLRLRTVDRELLLRLLDSWRRMVDNGWRIIDMRLAGDPALLEQLKSGYRRAVDALITKAARDLGVSREELYAQHNLRIAWWARRDLAPRESIVFILGAGDNFYTAAREYFNFTHARVVGDLRSLREVRNWLGANPPAGGLPWGDVSIVVHANLEGQMMTPVTIGGDRVTPESLREAIRNNSFRALPDRVVDNATRIVIRGCALGRNREILQLLRSGFGGREESPQIYAPVHLQSYEYQYRRRRRRRETTSAEEYFQEFWYVGFPSRPPPNPRALAQMFSARYPGVAVNWPRMLRTRGATRRQTYSITFTFQQTNVAPATYAGQRGRVRRQRQQELARLVRNRFADSRRWRDINETSRDVDDQGAITIHFEAHGGNQIFTGSIPDLLPRMRNQVDYRTLLSRQPGLLEATRPLEENSRLTADDFFWVLRTVRNRGARTFDFRFTGSRTMVRIQRDLVEPDPDRPGRTRRVHPDIDDPGHYGRELPLNY